MPHAQSVSCFVMLAAGSRYETARDERDRALRRAHVLQGHRAAADGARHRRRDRLDRRRVQRLHRQGVHGLLRPVRGRDRDVALDVLVDMLRHSKFDAEEIEREKGVIVEEMNMYFDTPRDYIGGVYDAAPLRRPAARLGHHRPQGDRARRDARDVPRLHRPLVPARAHGRRRRREDRRRPASSGSRGCSATVEPATTGAPRPGPCSPRTAARVQDAHEGSPTRRTSSLGVRELPARPPRPLRAAAARRPCSAAGCRRGSSPRCASGAGSPTTSSARTTRYTDAGSLYAQAGVDINRIDEAVETIVARAAADRRRAGAGRGAREGARTSRRAASCSQLESPHGTIMFGLRREVLEGRAAEPEEVLAGLDAVTAEDVQRVAQDVIGSDGLHLAADRAVRRRRALRAAARCVALRLGA